MMQILPYPTQREPQHMQKPLGIVSGADDLS